MEFCTTRTQNGSRELIKVDLKHLVLEIAENKMIRNGKNKPLRFKNS